MRVIYKGKKKKRKEQMKNGKENNVFTNIDQLSRPIEYVCLFYFFSFTLVTQVV